MASKDSMFRQWNMLRLVPRAPLSITAAEITERLAQAEYPIDKRTVERDLKALESLFPLLVDESAKPFKWSWRRDGAIFSLPGMSVPEALTLTMVEQHLQRQLPPSTLDALQPHFSAAAQTLAAIDDRARVALEVNATVTPQAVVIDASGTVRYRGRIDNRYVDVGKLRRVVTERDLKDALDAVIAGRPVAPAETTPVGCFIANR